uniref:UV excision repair protein RAD23 n=1 Tax=Chrysotila carterae TaxID=13221 RepID=A0A7S4BF29_CHRCT
MRLQVRCMDGDAFWVNTSQDATVASIKESIAEQRGIDVIMQKLICTGRVLQDEALVSAYDLSECDFLVLVTAKPRPPSLITTGAPLPPSYSTPLHAGDDDYGVDEMEDDVGEGGGEHHDSGHVDADESLVDRLLAMGFEPHESRNALRAAQNDTSLALAMLRSGHLAVDANALRSLEQRLRHTAAFGQLQEVVRVDPQVMLVLNTHDVRFEDQRTSQRRSRATLERLAIERAFLDACRKELSSQPPVFDRLLQLLREVRDSVSRCLRGGRVGLPSAYSAAA